jgi:putative ABC transport system permease protein
MRRLREWILRISGLFNKQGKDRELDDEIESHIQMHIDDNVRSGMTPAEARRQAMIKLGGIESMKEAYRDQRGLPWLDTLWQDVRYGVRMLRKNPGFTAVAVLTLALGIGANTAIFSFVNAVLIRPLPFKDADRLVTLWERNPKQGYDQNLAATGTFLDWQEENRSFEAMAIFESNIGFAVTGQAEAEWITGARASANLLHVLGVEPMLGRAFAKDEESAGKGQVAIVSYGLWQRHFGGDRNLVGKTIELDGKAYIVVGVMPPKFSFPGMTGVLFAVFANQPADIWVPLALDGEARQIRGDHVWQVIGRLKRGIALAQASAEMDAIQQRLASQHAGAFMGPLTKIIPLRTQGVANVRLGLLILFMAVGVLLLIACANVANLLLARAMGRRREMAVRLALGAARGRVIRQVLTESMLLAAVGALVGILVAEASIGALSRLVPSRVAATTPGWEGVGIDLPVFGFALLATLATVILFGLAPAWQAAQTDLQNSLKEGSGGTGAGKAKQRVHSALVSAQVALALMLLIAAGLLIRSFSRLERVNPGFQPARVLTMQLNLPDTMYPNDQQRAAFFDRLLKRLVTIPGVESVAMTLLVPFGGGGYNCAVTVEGRSEDNRGRDYTADWRPITADYLRTLGIPLVEGRAFSEQDQEKSQKVVLVNQSFVHAFLSGEDPLGKRIGGGIGGRFSRNGEPVIVGVVQDFKQLALDADVRPEMYTPQAQTPWYSSRTIVLRSREEPGALIGAMRNIVRELDPSLPITRLETMESLLSNSVAQPRFRTLLLSLFAGLAVVLAVIGIYGVIAFSVSQRVQEFGIRMALGAQRSDVLRLVLGHGMRLVLAGVGLGLVGALGLTRALRSLLFGVTSSDPYTFVMVSLILLGSAFAACYIPAHRATRVDPMQALHYE